MNKQNQSSEVKLKEISGKIDLSTGSQSENYVNKVKLVDYVNKKINYINLHIKQFAKIVKNKQEFITVKCESRKYSSGSNLSKDETSLVVKEISYECDSKQKELAREFSDYSIIFENAAKKPTPTPIASRFKVAVICTSNERIKKDFDEPLQLHKSDYDEITYPVNITDVKEISRTLDKIAADSSIDVLVVIRGGGDENDFWAFNDVGLAKKFHELKCFKIVGLGHADYAATLFDLAADSKEATPSLVGVKLSKFITDLKPNSKPEDNIESVATRVETNQSVYIQHEKIIYEHKINYKLLILAVIISSLIAIIAVMYMQLIRRDATAPVVVNTSKPIQSVHGQVTKPTIKQEKTPPAQVKKTKKHVSKKQVTEEQSSDTEMYQSSSGSNSTTIIKFN